MEIAILFAELGSFFRADFFAFWENLGFEICRLLVAKCSPVVVSKVISDVENVDSSNMKGTNFVLSSCLKTKSWTFLLKFCKWMLSKQVL